jgi:tungstate transport system substrate-binding protein
MLPFAYAMPMYIDSPAMNFSKPPAGYPPLPRRVLTLAAAALLCLFLLPAVAARADTGSSLTIVGTSDVSDSGLSPNLIQPLFSKAYPQFTYKYVGTATGTAITDAETGVNTPSVLIVHAASLENQFVGSGYSYEPYGRAIFTNDFVLAGPSGGSDPAGVSAPNATHNIVQAFANVASAGYNGGGAPRVTFVSRGGTPGTTVEEHKIWALLAGSPLAPAGVLFCAVSATNGGGDTPIAAGNGVTANGQACPNSGALPTGAALPSWYVTTGLTQGPNVVAANACTGYHSPAGNSCYVLTDRGTYDFLASGTDPAGTVPGLAILTRGPQDASAPGGANLLVNYFHAYIINPAKCTACGVNVPAAQDFVNFLTSPAFQAQLKLYLAKTSDAAGPPFVADASPILTATGFPKVATGGKPVTVTGTLTNAEPGYPALANQTVSVDQIVAGVGVPVATGKTNATGAYSILFTPRSSGSYQVSTTTIAQIEDATLSPPFGDLLSPSATAAVSVKVKATVSITRRAPAPGGIAVSGVVAPAPSDAHGTVTILARRQGSHGGYRKIGQTSLRAGESAYVTTGLLKAGKWQVTAKYGDPGQVVGASSSPVKVTLAAATSAVRFKTLTASGGKLTVTGTLNPAPAASGARVELFALPTVAIAKTVVGKRVPVFFKVIAKTSAKTGKTKFTIKATLTPGYRWVLQLEYIQKGQRASFSKLSAIDVH